MSRNHSSLYVDRVSSPKTPCNTNLANNIPVHFTPVEQCAETERDPEPPHKEQPIKKKTSHVSKRKLFLQSGQKSKVNKVKKQTTPIQPKTSFTSKKVPISPPCQADATRFSYPLTERQQLQYLLEVTAKEAKHDSECGSGDDLIVSSSKTKKKDYLRESQAEYRVRKRNERGETALHLAAIRGDLDDLVLLLQAGALVNVKDNAGWTPLHEACNYGNLRIVQELVWSGADVNCPGYEAITPLHDAVINDHVKVVQFLISNGADLSLQTSQNYNVLDLARSAAMLDVLTQQHNKDATTFSKDNVNSVLVPPMITQPLPYKTYHITPDLITNGMVSHNMDQERHQYSEAISSQSSLESSASQTPLGTEPCPYGHVETTSIIQRQMEEENFHPRAMPLSRENCHRLPGERLVSKADNQITDLTAAENDSQVNGISRNDNKVELPCSSHSSGKEFISLPAAVSVKPVNGATKFFVRNSQPPSVLETDDSVLPEKLNECLDKALIEISTYLESSQNMLVVHKEKMSRNYENNEDVCNKVNAHVEDNTLKDAGIQDSQQKAWTSYTGVGTEVEYVPCTDASKEMEGRTDACDARATERMAEDIDIGEKSDTGFTRIKTRYERKRANIPLQVDKYSRLGRRKKPSTRISECEKSERNDYNQVKEECLNHIANRTWRSDLPKYRYNVSSLPLCLPGYEDFLINSRSNMLNWSCLSFDQSCFGKENQLKKVLTQHFNEKVKLRMALEQELVRVFTNFARRSVGFSVPYGACTVIGSQMRPQETQIFHSEEMDRGSIKLEVDKILKKFSLLEVKMLRRQRHEFEAAIALEKLTTDNRDFNGSGSIFTAKWAEHYSHNFNDFGLVPAKFAEYYEEVLCASE